MFKIDLPDNPTIEAFKKAKASLISQYAKKSANAPQKDEYAFGQKISASVYNVRRSFIGALRVLCDCCKLQTGVTLMDEKTINALEDE